jgi:hypothetical protein
LGFLGASPFRRESQGNDDWISLDFLGFSRPNRAFSKGYKDISANFFSHGFSRFRAPEKAALGVQGTVGSRNVHGANLA